MKRIEFSENGINAVFDISDGRISLVHLSVSVFDERKTSVLSKLDLSDITDSSDQLGRVITVTQTDGSAEYVGRMHFFKDICVVALSCDKGSDIFDTLPESSCYTAVMNDGDIRVTAFSDNSEENARGELIKYQRLVRRRCRDNAQLPVIFDASDIPAESLEKAIENASYIGCNYFVLAESAEDLASQVRSSGMTAGTYVSQGTDPEAVIRRFRAGYLIFEKTPDDISALLKKHPDLTVQLPDDADTALLKTGALMYGCSAPEQSLCSIDLSGDISGQLYKAMLSRPVFCGIPDENILSEVRSSVDVYKSIRSDIKNSLPLRIIYEYENADSFEARGISSDGVAYISLRYSGDGAVILPDCKDSRSDAECLFCIGERPGIQWEAETGRLSISACAAEGMALIRIN